MWNRRLYNIGSTNRKLFANTENLDSHAMKVTKQSQDKFYSLEKANASEQAKESFKRKPYQTH